VGGEGSGMEGGAEQLFSREVTRLLGKRKGGGTLKQEKKNL